MAAGAFGGIIIASHDNQAQAVPPSPFTKEEPDDWRGFYDEDNQSKPELTTLTELFSDLRCHPAGV